ncbi:hypothetical protein E3N88_18442 [Mikania micrantha]|uniref:Uncharacterized protein n=1 Tax=Mikania micrantha TaxID=192012 RepID=A0A5N6NKF2_9ASTR|nr:hypothetical protein E3N88_18442 [Mikania micrantha]
MEDQKECDMKGNHILPLYFDKFPPSPLKVQEKEFEEQYLMMNHERIRINDELDQWKQIEWKMLEIKNLQRWNQDQVDLHSPADFVPRTTGYLRLTGMDAQTLVTPDRKRCQKRMIKKGRMDVEYLQQVQTEHLFLKKPSGKTSSDIQELNDMIESMVQRIQHGNKKRVDEIKLYQQISNFKETKEIFIAREPNPQRQQWYTRELTSKRDRDLKRSLQTRIHIRLDDIENIKRRLIGRKTRVRRLKAELEHVRKNIS